MPGDEKLCCNHSCNPSLFFETTSSAGLIAAKVSCFSVRMAPALLCLHCMLGVPSSICCECHRALHIHRTQNARSSVTLHSPRLPFMPAERSCLLILRSIRLTNKPTRLGVGMGGGGAPAPLFGVEKVVTLECEWRGEKAFHKKRWENKRQGRYTEALLQRRHNLHIILN